MLITSLNNFGPCQSFVDPVVSLLKIGTIKGFLHLNLNARQKICIERKKSKASKTERNRTKN